MFVIASLGQFRSRVSTRHAACTLALIAALGCGDDKTNEASAPDGGGGGTGGKKSAGGSGGTSAGGHGGTQAAGGSDAGTAQAGLMIKLADGVVQGDMAGASRRFLSIPFAKPPLGKLRWKAPVKNDPWTGVRHEREFVQPCAQLADQGSPASNNEDCLYLNVWAPETVSTNAPVMVWIHGGGNFSGGAGIPIPLTAGSVSDPKPDPCPTVSCAGTLWYDGQYFASRQGVVLVTIQYRLGPMGFFAHPGLADEKEPAGNQGLLDQRMALQWVQDNVAKFGGDPNNVTIFGESAGSADVCYHVVSKGSRGLFHRAIGESGGCSLRSIGAEPKVADIAKNMVAYGKAAGCAEGADQLSCLRDAKIEDLLSNAMQPMPGAGGSLTGADWSFTAVIDGADGFLSDAPQALFDSGNIADVPYLLGSNNDEGATFVVRATSLTSEDDYMADLSMRFGDRAKDVAAIYPPSDFDGDFDAARSRVIGDAVVCSTHDTARRAQKAGRKVFMYNFDVEWAIAPTVLHAGHASEISHVFGAPYMADADSQKVGDAMNTYWAQFAKSGDPNGAHDPAVWPAFKIDDDKRLELDPKWSVQENFRTKECAFWRQYYGGN